MRIPIRIKDDYSISCLQVQTQTTGTSRQQEQEVIRVRGVKLFQHLTTIVRLGCSVQPRFKNFIIYVIETSQLKQLKLNQTKFFLKRNIIYIVHVLVIKT